MDQNIVPSIPSLKPRTGPNPAGMLFFLWIWGGLTSHARLVRYGEPSTFVKMRSQGLFCFGKNQDLHVVEATVAYKNDEIRWGNVQSGPYSIWRFHFQVRKWVVPELKVDRGKLHAFGWFSKFLGDPCMDLSGDFWIAILKINPIPENIWRIFGICWCHNQIHHVKFSRHPCQSW